MKIESMLINEKKSVLTAMRQMDETAKKILYVVDDNEVNLKVIKKALTYYGIDADTATSGIQSIEMCRSKEYSIVFMDQMMPEMDGIEAMKRIRKISEFYDISGRCRIVALTANAIQGVREELIAEGFDEYLSKPIEFDKLEEILIM